MAILPYCPPDHVPSTGSPRSQPIDFNNPGVLYDDLPLDEKNRILAYYQQKPIEQDNLDFRQSGPDALGSDAQIIICFSTLAVRTQIVETSKQNPIPTYQGAANGTHGTPFYRMSDTLIIPRPRGYKKSTPVYQQISENERLTKYEAKCIFQDDETGSFYIGPGAKDTNGFYPYSNTFYRFASGGILYSNGAHNYYLRLPKPGAIPITF